MKQEFTGIWLGEKDLTGDQEFIKNAQNEIQNESLADSLANGGAEEVGGNRRDFLKMLGFGLGAATVAAGCDAPVRRAIPYVIKPEEIVPGVATYYASTFVKGGESCPVLVKTREGRPIKIEGNKLSHQTKGGTSARAQASVLSLYDVNRLREPMMDGEATTWDALDAKVKNALATAKGIRLITHTIMSPSTEKVIAKLKAVYPQLEVVTYDPVSASALLEANAKSFGVRAVPQYRFDKADLIVSFNADFLGTWISPEEYNRQYITNRVIDDVDNAKMSRHVQVESQMSMTGSNADNRILVKPSQQGAALSYLYGAITGNKVSTKIDDATQKALNNLAKQLLAAKGKSLVVCGNNDVNQQLLTNAINETLSNYGNTLSLKGHSNQRKGDEKQLVQAISDIKSGKVDTVILHDCNPAFEYGSIPGIVEAFGKLKNGIALTYENNRTAESCNIIAPIHHYLESWGDVEARSGEVTMIQPTIAPLFNTRQAETSLMAWAGDDVSNTEQAYYNFIRNNWKESFFANQSKYLSFQLFWDHLLHNGLYHYEPTTTAVETAVVDYTAAARGAAQVSPSGEIELQFVENIGIGNGQYANNPWLQELPDPVTRTTWGNYLAVPVGFDGVKKFEALNGLKDGDLVDVSVGDKTYRVPVVQQFGQAKGTVSLALGYGRAIVGGAGRNIGVDVNGAIPMQDGRAQYFVSDVKVSGKKGKEEHYSSVQYHHTMGVTDKQKSTGETINADEAALAPGYGNLFEGYQGALVDRSIIRKSHVNDLKKSVDDLKHEREHHQHLNDQTLYPYEEYKKEKYDQGHHWGMHVDLNACTGCGACVVACMSENNVPVVGKKQVARHQEMSWLRIDRYYYGDVNNPNVVYQPMMCQHCDNAPCENVCPVNATNHSSEGLNQMTYNRCIGTRYCANNCPYKVRRFNWLDYTKADLFPGNSTKINEEEMPFYQDNLTRMVLNPDVTVRSRGVIEKCSFCVQRIQEGKLTAKKEGRKLKDGDVQSACQTACPGGCITFGDTNLEEGELHDKLQSPLNMIVLEEINVRSSVTYTMKVNNRDKTLEV